MEGESTLMGSITPATCVLGPTMTHRISEANSFFG